MERSIAVLPLANAGGDPGQQFFSDGLSDNLIDALSRFDGLKVIGRASSFRFRDSDDDSRSIGTQLGVAYLISGSVQHVGNAVRIGVQLNSTMDGHTVWTEHYDRPYRDLFALQDEIAHAVATALQAKLLRSQPFAKQDDHPPGGNLDAYNAYLRGMQSFFRQDMRKTLEYLGIATRLDPGYAAAWAQSSVAWALIGYDKSGDEAQTAFRNSRAAVDEALKLAPDLGIAHAAMGNLRLGADFDWRGAVAELRRGTELAPGNGPIHGGFSRALAATGRLREAFEERQRALSIEPLQATNYFLYSDLLIAAGRLDEAEKTVRIGQGLRPRPAPRTR
jgi:TolB-like protein